jgi:7,8-dihydroneopterin aldolase/epimerase/oxygenase
MIPAEDYNRVLLEDVTVELSIGLHPWEKPHPQRVAVTVELFWRPRGNGAWVDYDPIRDAIRSWVGRPHVELIETLAEELVERCFTDPRVEACRVAVRKLDIFPEARAAGVEFTRRRK